MSRRRRALVAVGVVLAAATGGWWSARPHDAPAPPVASAAEGNVAARVDPPARAPASPVRRPVAAVAATMAALPPVGTDPASVIAALLADADAGDALAACRVGLELVTCQWAAAMRGERWIRGDLESMFGAEEATRQARLDDAIEAAHVRCEAIPAATRARTAELLGEAARAGDPEATLLYAQGMHLVGHTTRDFMAHPGFERWRSEALPLVWRQFRAGDRRAVFMLSIGHDGHFGLFDGLVEDDPVTARAMSLLAARLSGRPGNGRRALASADEARAAALAARWHDEHFDGRVTAEEMDMGSMLPPMPWFDGSRESERCTGVIPP